SPARPRQIHRRVRWSESQRPTNPAPWLLHSGASPSAGTRPPRRPTGHQPNRWPPGSPSTASCAPDPEPRGTAALSSPPCNSTIPQAESVCQGVRCNFRPPKIRIAGLSLGDFSAPIFPFSLLTAYLYVDILRMKPVEVAVKDYAERSLA